MAGPLNMAGHDSTPSGGILSKPFSIAARCCERVGNIFLAVARRLRRRVEPAGNKPLTVAIVMPLGGAGADWIQQTKFDWLCRYGISPGLEATPHITLKMGCKVGDLGPLASYVEQLARHTPAQTVKLHNVKSFDGGIMFLDVVDTTSLERLRRQIIADLKQHHAIEPEALEGDAFHFHATLGFGLPPAIFAAEYQRLSRQNISFTDVATTLELWVDMGSHWVSYRRAELAPARPVPELA